MFGFPRLQALVSEHAEEERSLQETLERNSTPLLGKAGSKRTTSPSLRYDAPHPLAELPENICSTYSSECGQEIGPRLLELDPTHAAGSRCSGA